MTTTYESEEEAIHWGLYYAGVSSDPAARAAKKGKISVKVGIIGPPKECNLYEVQINKKPLMREGQSVRFAVGRFRNGYDLWLIGTGGMMQRT